MPHAHAVDAIAAGIHQAQGLYHRLLLLVGPSGTGKSATLTTVSQQFGATLVNIALELSRSLLELDVRQRRLQVGSLLTRCVHGAAQRGGDIVLLDNTELLFDASLQQDPLRLLQNVARNITVVAAWTGDLHEGSLRYAALGHPEYRRYPTGDLMIVVAGKAGEGTLSP